MRQFLAVEFVKGGRKYTYHNDGLPVRPGQQVYVETRQHGQQLVEVVGTTDTPPAFETKPILGFAAEED